MSDTEEQKIRETAVALGMNPDSVVAQCNRMLKKAKEAGFIIPQTIACKICDLKFPNPILNGSKIVTVVCGGCKKSIIDSFRPKKRGKKK